MSRCSACASGPFSRVMRNPTRMPGGDLGWRRNWPLTTTSHTAGRRKPCWRHATSRCSTRSSQRSTIRRGRHALPRPHGTNSLRAIRQDWHRLRKAAKAADRATTLPDRAARLHEVRKAAKRARYSAEAIEPAFGRDAARFALAVANLQTVLGDHHDDVVTSQKLRDLAGTAGHDSDAFAFADLATRLDESNRRRETSTGKPSPRPRTRTGCDGWRAERRTRTSIVAPPHGRATRHRSSGGEQCGHREPVDRSAI